MTQGTTSTDPADAYLLVIAMLRRHPEMIAKTWRLHQRSWSGSCTGCEWTLGTTSYENCQYRSWAKTALASLNAEQQRHYAEPQ
jgi:hypothetical protein